MRLKTNTSKLSTSSQGPVWGSLYLHEADTAFPEIDWNDIVFGVMALWIPGLRDLHQGKRSHASFRFMDGDLGFDLKTTPTGEIILYQGYKKRIKKYSGPFDLQEFLASYAKVFRETEKALGTKFPNALSNPSDAPAVDEIRGFIESFHGTGTKS
jgi:hypothetical protein